MLFGDTWATTGKKFKIIVAQQDSSEKMQMQSNGSMC